VKTKTIKLEILENVIPLPCREVSEEGQWVFVEFPYKHLLPVLEVA
tara:strand:+ start:757 stop:894 length:138 start_codon:yes stop_codon:yes gene_type:complete